MTSQDVFALQNSDFSGFLFAEVGKERSGLDLSVFSILARLGVDPWHEAARLAALPRAAAAHGLAGIIATSPGGPWTAADATDISARLVALLPGGGSARFLRPAAGTVWKRPAWGWQAAALAALATLLAGLALSSLAQPERPPDDSRRAGRLET